MEKFKDTLVINEFLLEQYKLYPSLVNMRIDEKGETFMYELNSLFYLKNESFLFVML
jgi:hypothetical protein